MRWGSETLRFARPIRTLVAAARRAPAAPRSWPACARAAPCAGTASCGRALELARAGDYVDALEGGGRRRADRRSGTEIIRAALDAAAQELGATWSDPGGVLREVVYLVERPRALRRLVPRRAPARCPTACS